MFTKLARNTTANYAGTIIVTGIGFFITPFLVRELGATQYGIWALLGSTIAYLQLLDLGFSTALAKYVAQYTAQHRDAELSELCGTVFAVYLALAGAAGVFIWWFAPHFPTLFNVPVDEATVATQAFLLVGLNFMILLPTSLFNAVLVGYQRIDSLNWVNVFAQATSAGLTVVLLLQGYGLLAVAMVSIFTTLLLASGRLYYVRKFAARLSLAPQQFRWDLARSMFSFSSAIFLVQVSALILFQMDNIILGLFYPIAIITPYAVTYKLANFVRVLTVPISSVLFPAYAELDGRMDASRLERLYLEGTRVTALTAGLLVTFLLFAGTDVLVLWVGNEYAEMRIVLGILALFFGLHAIARVSSVLLISLGQARLRMNFAIAETLVNLTLCVVMGKIWAMTGVALANLMSLIIVDAFVMIPMTARHINISAGRYLQQGIWPAVLPCTATGLYLFVGRQWLPIQSWPTAFGYVGTSAIVFACVFLSIGIGRSERAEYVMRLRNLIRPYAT